MGYHSLRLCAGGGAYEAIPSPRLRLDLRQVKGTLESNEIPVVDARVMLIAQLKREVTLSRDGRVLIKTHDGEEASEIFHHLQTLLKLPGVEPST